MEEPGAREGTPAKQIGGRAEDAGGTPRQGKGTLLLGDVIEGMQAKRSRSAGVNKTTFQWLISDQVKRILENHFKCVLG